MPLGHPLAGEAAGDGGTAWPGPAGRERAVLESAAAVVTTSRWTRDGLLDRYASSPDRMHVAEPGADRPLVATGTPAGGELLCVAAVVPDKGHGCWTPWLGRRPAVALRLRRSLDRAPARCPARDSAGTGDRRPGAASPAPLAVATIERAYAAADLLVLAVPAETYGMVVTEALAHGLPVVATIVGGVPGGAGQARRRPSAGAARAGRRSGRRSRAAVAGSPTPTCGTAAAAARQRRTTLSPLVATATARGRRPRGRHRARGDRRPGT